MAVSEETQAPEVGEHLDYRKYLLEFYNFKRKTERVGRRAYNYSAFSASADIKSPNYLKMIIEGKRNLSSEMIDRFSKALRHTASDRRDFRLLVSYNQEMDPVLRASKLKELAEYRYAQKKPSQDEENLLDDWLNLVIHQLADQEGVDINNIEQLSQLIRVRPRPERVQQSIDALVGAGVFEKIGGQLHKVKSNIESPENVPFEVIRKLQSELIFLGLESLFSDSSSDREFGGATLNLTKEEFKRLKFDLRKFRKAWHRDIEASREATQGDRVYQLNIQLFPITNSSNAEKKTGPKKAPRERGMREDNSKDVTVPPESLTDVHA